MRRIVVGAALVAAGCSAKVGTAPPPEPTANVDGFVLFEARERGWDLIEIADRVHQALGDSILCDEWNGPRRMFACLAPDESAVVRKTELLPWFQGLLARRGGVLVPAPARGLRQWFILEPPCPGLTPTFVDEGQVLSFARPTNAYVVTTLTVPDGADMQALRNELAPLLTQTAGIGRLTDLPNAPTLIVADYAPVVAAIKRRKDFLVTVTGIFGFLRPRRSRGS